MHSDGFEPVIPEIRLIQTYALDRTATGTGVERILRSPEFYVELTYPKLFHHLFYIYTSNKKESPSCA